jgi:hypothetical protein
MNADHMPRKKTKKARKPLKFKTITLKVTAKQKKSLVNFCRSRRTTPIKVIKKAIGPLLNNYSGLKTSNVQPVAVNQLELF